MRRRRGAVGAFGVLAALATHAAACGPGADAPLPDAEAAGPEPPPAAPSGPAGPAPEVEVWSISAEPLVEIGVVSGDEAYELSQVRDAAFLPDGSVLVADGGSNELRVFGPDGRFLRAQGRSGRGPGEWSMVTELDVRAPDTVVVVDAMRRRVGLVDPTAGAFLGDGTEGETARYKAPTTWFHGGLAIDLDLPPGERGIMRPVLDALDPAESWAPTWLSVDSAGRVRVEGFAHPGEERREIRFHDLDGRLRARLELPSGLALLELTDDRLLAATRDSLDVEYVRVYALEGRGAWEGPTLAEARGRGAGPLPAVPAAPEAAVEKLQPVIESLSNAQAHHYARVYSYASDPSALDGPNAPVIPGGVRFDLLSGDGDHWAGRLIDEATGAGCFIMYGSTDWFSSVTPASPLCWSRAAR